MYEEMVHLPRPYQHHVHMDVARRAKQFAPFAALKGFEDCVRQKEIVYEERRMPSEEQERHIDEQLKLLRPGKMLTVLYFTENPADPGKGQYRTVTGKAAFFDPAEHLRVEDREIRIPDILDLEVWPKPA